MDISADQMLALSDSDDDIEFSGRKKHGKQALRIEESDSEEENVTAITERSANVSGSEENKEENSTKRIEFREDSEEFRGNSESDVSNASENIPAKRKKKKKRKSDERKTDEGIASKINSLCDQDSSSDESYKEETPQKEPQLKRERVPQRMSAKQAEEQMKLIKSESQRLTRETNLSVPYHKPKSYSLKEFLNRKTINKAVPMALTKKAAATIKMSKEELEEYAKSLEDRNKESQEFYRSDSDDSVVDRTDCNELEQQVPNSTKEPGDTINSTITSENAEVKNDSVETVPIENDPMGNAPMENVPMENVPMETVLIANSSVENSTLEIVTLESDSMENCVAEKIVTDSDAAESHIAIETDIVEKFSDDVANPIISQNSSDKPENDANLNVNHKTVEIDYSFGESERIERNSLREYLSSKSTEKPSLKGPINGVINLDLDDVNAPKSGGDELFERFLKHVAKKPTRNAKEVNILSTDNGVIEIKNMTIESDEQNCIYSKPRTDCFKLKSELSFRIAAKRREELLKKQDIARKENDDSDLEIEPETKCGIENEGEIIEEKKECIDGETRTTVDQPMEEDGSDGNDEIEDQEGHESDDEKEQDDDDEADEEDEGDDNNVDCDPNDSNESMKLSDENVIENPKRRRRIIILDNSDDDEPVRNNEQEPVEKDTDLNSCYIEQPIADQTDSQISKNQNLADQIIDSCSKIVLENNEIDDNNTSTLFTQPDIITESQLLDLCSGTFATQVVDTFPSSSVELSSEPKSLDLLDDEFSDDDIGLPTKTKRKIINISDDEEPNEEPNEAPSEETANNSQENKVNNVEDDDSNALDEDLSDEEVEEAEERIVEYDSEENEIEVPKMKITDFVENEAELSESEWGSADEDEKNMDNYEIELGDEDNFDQSQLHSELDRIHRRRMLDQDAREVKIIKDTHFEDEEESGLGRQRQFKWKHMENSINMEDSNTENVDTVLRSDDENEEDWRRMRHERNNLLQDTSNQNDTATETTLSVTTKTKKRISIAKNAVNLNTSGTKSISFLISKAKEERTHRSSLLTRDEATLANLSKIISDDGIPSINANSKNFLFNVICSDDESPSTKRKLEHTEEDDSKSRPQKKAKRIKKSTLSVLDKVF